MNVVGAIPSLLATLMERLEGRESLELEFKSAKGGIPRDLWPTVSAFANTSGGWIVLGVDELEGKFTVGGVANPSGMLKSIHDQMRNRQRISCEVCGANDSTIESLGNKQVIVLRIPAAPRRMRPVYIGGNPYDGTYVRRHSGDYHCTKPEVDRMMREASDVAADSTILKGYGWDDLELETLARYRRRFQTRNPGNPWNDYDDQRFLQTIGGFARHKETGEEGITVAGLLMFGRPESILAWRTRHLIDYRLVSEDEIIQTRWDDRVVWEGNLLGAFDAIYPRLVEGQQVPFRLEGGVRIDEGPAHVALREALVNLLVHADYAEPQTSLVKRSPDGYLFRNPGSSRVSEIDLFTGDRSDPRNPHLVRMFRFIGLAEEAGSGMSRIVRAWRDLGFRMPSVEVGTERYEFSLQLRHAHMLSEEDRGWLHAIGGGWSEAEQLALVMAKHEGYVDNVGLRSLTGQHPADATRVLGNLRDRGLLQIIGAGRGARYELGPKAQPGSTSDIGVTARQGDQALVAVLAETDLGDKGQSLGDKGESLGDSGRGIGDSGGGAQALRRELLDIAGPARAHRRLRPETLDDVIVALCGRVPLSVQELSEVLERSREHIRRAVNALVASGRLTYLYPGQPRHPHQKYVAKTASP
ncbi:MAG: RNA-binding domain-containing protein [Sphingomonadaceae bacterium]